MPEVIGIRFKSCGKIYLFAANGFRLQKGDRVVVESEFGVSIGSVVQDPYEIESPEKELKRIIRVATEEDFRQTEENEKFARDARSFCFERIMARGLPMKLVCSEVTLDRKRIVFYFTADGRIDFRELVKDLAARFKTRIEMRQIGVRDKAKMVGGLGLCGKELCCRLFLTSFEPISIKMAKQQELVLNTGKLAGICGRLMCCLGYEYHEGGADAVVKTGDRTAVDSAEPEQPEETPAESVAGTEMMSRAPEPAAVDSAVGEAQGEQKKTEGFKKKNRRRRRYRKKFRKQE